MVPSALLYELLQYLGGWAKDGERTNLAIKGRLDV